MVFHITETPPLSVYCTFFSGKRLHDHKKLCNIVNSDEQGSFILSLSITLIYILQNTNRQYHDIGVRLSFFRHHIIRKFSNKKEARQSNLAEPPDYAL